MMMGGANANYGQVPWNNTTFSGIANPNYIAARSPQLQQQPEWLQQLHARQQHAPQQHQGKDTVNVDAGGSFVRVERDGGGQFVQVCTTSPGPPCGKNVYPSSNGMNYAGQPQMYQQQYADPVYQAQLNANTIYQQQAQPVYQQPQQVAQPVYQVPQTQPQMQQPVVSQVYNQPQQTVYQPQPQHASYHQPPPHQYQPPAPSTQHHQAQIISQYQPSSPSAPRRRHSIHQVHQQKHQYDEPQSRHYSSSTTLKEQQKKFNNAKKPQPQVKALSTSERYQQYRQNSFSSISSSSLSEDAQFEPYSYRDWLNLKSRDGSMKLPASIGVHEDAGGRDKVLKMNEYASKQQRNRNKSYRTKEA
jgi:hypothetical protein